MKIMLKKIIVMALVSFFSLSTTNTFAKDIKKQSKTRKIQINGTMGEVTSKLLIKAEGLYLMGDNDTPSHSREMCLINEWFSCL